MKVGVYDRKFYIDFLRDVDEAGMSGILRLRQNRSLKALFFEEGNLVFAISNIPDEELGQHLVNLGKVPTAYMKWLHSQVSREHSLTYLLSMQQNVISHTDLAQAQQEVVAGIAVSCFNWENGEYTFDGSRTADHEFKTQLRALDLLIEGIRRLRDEGYIQKALGDHSQLVRAPVDTLARANLVHLNSLEKFVLSKIDQKKTVDQLIKDCGKPQMETLRVLYSMLAAGVLDPLEENVPPEESQKPTPMMATLAMPDPPTPSSPRVSGAFSRLSPLDQTYSALQTAQKQSPTRPPTELRRSISKIDTGRLEAIAGIKIRSSTGPSKNPAAEARSEQYFIQGKQLLRMGDLRNAEKMFRQASELSSEKAKYLLGLSMLLMKRPAGKREAEGLLLRCCELEPLAVEPRIQLAGIYEQQGNAARAEQLYKSVLNIDPNHPIATEKLKDPSGFGSIFMKMLKK